MIIRRFGELEIKFSDGDNDELDALLSVNVLLPLVLIEPDLSRKSLSVFRVP